MDYHDPLNWLYAYLAFGFLFALLCAHIERRSGGFLGNIPFMIIVIFWCILLPVALYQVFGGRS